MITKQEKEIITEFLIKYNRQNETKRILSDCSQIVFLYGLN
jgi:hypothetical protein